MNCSTLISSVCEKYTGPNQCGKPVAWLYPALGGGWMALCKECAKPHQGTQFKFLHSIRELIDAGVEFTPPISAPAREDGK